MNVRLSGRLVVPRLDELRAQVATAATASDITLDLSAVEAMDTAGAWLVIDPQPGIQERGGRCEIIGATKVHNELLDVVRQSIPKKETAGKSRHSFFDWLEAIGQKTWNGVHGLIEIVGFLGSVVARFGFVVIHPCRLRLTSLVHHMQEIGFNAVPEPAPCPPSDRGMARRLQPSPPAFEPRRTHPAGISPTVRRGSTLNRANL